MCHLFASNRVMGFEFLSNDSGTGGLLLLKGVAGILGWPPWLQLMRV